MSNDNCFGHLHTIDKLGLREFVADKEGALNIIEQLRGGAKQRWRFDLVNETVSALFEKHGFNQSYRLPLNKDLTVHRARKLKSCAPESWPSSSDELGPRKAEEMTDYGRCHRPQPQKSIGYFSLYTDIALAEVEAKMGDCIAIATYQQTKRLTVVPVGELDFYRRTGQTYLGDSEPKAKEPYEKALGELGGSLKQLVDAFFAEEFIKPASASADYKITAALSELLVNFQTKKTKIDAIYYPSVAFRAGYNLAILAESVQQKMKLVATETKIVQISDVLGFGIFEFKNLSTLKSVNETGQLEWS